MATKRAFSILLLLFVLFSANAFAQDPVQESSAPAHITVISLLGEQWGNENRGGFFFFTDNLPEGIDYFIVRGPEKYVDRLLAMTLFAKSANKLVAIQYSRVLQEGEIAAITTLD